MTDIKLPENVLGDLVAEIAQDPKLNSGIAALQGRRADFGTEIEMLLTGIAAVPEARALLDDRLDDVWREIICDYTTVADEVVIGAGLHAAVYCAARVRSGFPRPLVLERGRVGGAFAMSRRPSFLLATSNRPALLRVSYAGGLNHLPGAPIQPDNLSGTEYPTNADLAWVIRVTLARYARVRTAAEVTAVVNRSEDDHRFTISLHEGGDIACHRVIDARGLVDHDDRAGASGTADNMTIKTFPQFMASLDSDFPLQGMKRVAVVGGGDAGKCTVEALLGIGPAVHRSSAKLDFVQQIDWYARGLPATCDGWRATPPGRYQAIGAYLQGSEDAGESPRLRIYGELGLVSKGLEAAYVNERLYDTVIIATGWRRQPLSGVYLENRRSDVESYPVIAREFGSRGAYAIGPVAEITEGDDSIGGLAPRTAALAVRLPLRSGPPVPF